MLAAAAVSGAAWVVAASATPAPPAIVCAGNGVPVAPGGVATQGPVSCTGLALPGMQVQWATGSPAGTASGVAPSPAPITFAGGGDGLYTVQASQTDVLDPAPPITSDVAGFTLTLDTLPPTVPAPEKPDDGGRVSSTTPELGWAASADAGSGVLHYVVTLDGAQAAVAGTRWRVPSALAQGAHSWQVAALDRIGRASAPSRRRTFVVDTVPPQMTAIDPPDGATGVAAVPTVTAAFSEPVKPGTLRLCVTSCAAGPVIAARTTWTASGAALVPTAPLSAFTRYQAGVADVTDLAGNPVPPVSATFTTGDLGAAPGPVSGLTLTPGPGRVSLAFAPPPDPALARIRVLRRAGTAPSGPSDPAAAAFDLPAAARAYDDAGLAAGVRVFYALYGVDRAGRFSATAATGSAVPTAAGAPAAGGSAPAGGAPAVAARTGAKRARPAPRIGVTYRAGLLRPRRGAALRTLRPVLSWRGTPRGTRLVNLQIFEQRAGGRATRKVLSRFPTSGRFRVPTGVLVPGRTYVWRVWPWTGRAYTARALAQSTFRAPPAHRST